LVLKSRDLLRFIISSVKNRISNLHCKVINLIFGPTIKLGTYEKERLLYPIIILNGKLLVELDTLREKSLSNFFFQFEELYFDKYSLYENKLKELLKGQNFPIESLHVPKAEEISGTYIYPRKEIPMDERYRPTKLPIDFALNVYKLTQEEDYKDFLNFILAHYFRFNIWHKEEMDSYWFKSDEIHNLFMTFDLSSLILLQEQADSFANCLEKEFKAVIDYRYTSGEQTTFGRWFEKLIKELRQANLIRRNC
jgi:hypothetical protein